MIAEWKQFPQLNVILIYLEEAVYFWKYPHIITQDTVFTLKLLVSSRAK